MPGIWNVNNSYNVNNSNKKISSKLTFDVGEKFSGKIIKNDSGNEVSIKLTDGWEFPAEVEGNLNSLEKGFHRFEVEGFKDGKLKLKLINKDNEKSSGTKNELNNIISKEGLSKKDIPLLEAMLKHDIPLTTENIKVVKGLIQFNDKVNGNPKEIEKFISKYLESKGIDENSSKGEIISKKLEEFLNVFKSLSKDEVLLFLENNIEFTEENIESYNKLFKENGKVSNIINEMKSELQLVKTGMEKESGLSNSSNINLGENKNLESSKIELPKDISNLSKEELKAAIEIIKNNGSKTEISNNKLVAKLYEKNDVAQNKISMLSVLKSLMGGSENQLNIELKDLINNRRTEFTTKEFDKVYNIINKIDDDTFVTMLKNSISESKSPDISFDNYVNKRTNESKFGNTNLSFNKVELENVLSKAIGKNVILTEEEFTRIKDIINLKVLNSDNLSNISQNGVLSEELEREVLFKDGTQNNKNESLSKNINEIIEKTTQDSLNNKGITNLESDSTGVLRDLIRDKLSTQEIVKNVITSKGEEGKEVIRAILESIKNESEISGKILDVIKNNISDIKLFNKISQEYYYLDIPVNIKDQEYPCKLILKDNRKGGKKIDSTNVKMVVTVKTGSLGVVDGYIKVLEKKINIDLKCEDSFVKILDLGKEKLASNIRELGFNISINVSKREEEVSLTNCREFFNENNRANIDIKV